MVNLTKMEVDNKNIPIIITKKNNGGEFLLELNAFVDYKKIFKGFEEHLIWTGKNADNYCLQTISGYLKFDPCDLKNFMEVHGYSLSVWEGLDFGKRNELFNLYNDLKHYGVITEYSVTFKKTDIIKNEIKGFRHEITILIDNKYYHICRFLKSKVFKKLCECKWYKNYYHDLFYKTKNIAESNHEKEKRLHIEKTKDEVQKNIQKWEKQMDTYNKIPFNKKIMDMTLEEYKQYMKNRYVKHE